MSPSVLSGVHCVLVSLLGPTEGALRNDVTGIIDLHPELALLETVADAFFLIRADGDGIEGLALDKLLAGRDRLLLLDVIFGQVLLALEDLVVLAQLVLARLATAGSARPTTTRSTGATTGKPLHRRAQGCGKPGRGPAPVLV